MVRLNMDRSYKEDTVKRKRGHENMKGRKVCLCWKSIPITKPQSKTYLTRNVEVVGSGSIKSRPDVVSLSKKLYPCCLVLVGSRNGFEYDFTIELT